MTASHVSALVLALAVALSPVVGAQDAPDRELLRVAVSDQAPVLEVSMHLGRPFARLQLMPPAVGGSTPSAASQSQSLKDLHIQVWLLRKDGTAVAQEDVSGPVSIVATGHDYARATITVTPEGQLVTPGVAHETYWFMLFSFVATGEDELAAVVTRVDGKMRVWTLPGNTTPPAIDSPRG